MALYGSFRLIYKTSRAGRLSDITLAIDTRRTAFSAEGCYRITFDSSPFACLATR